MPAIPDAGRRGPVQPAPGPVVCPRPDVRSRPARRNGKSIPAGIPGRKNTLFGRIVADVVHPKIDAEIGVVGQAGVAVSIRRSSVKNKIAIIIDGIGGIADKGGVVAAVA